MNSIEYIKILMLREIKLYEIEIMALLTLSPFLFEFVYAKMCVIVILLLLDRQLDYYLYCIVLKHLYFVYDSGSVDTI